VPSLNLAWPALATQLDIRVLDHFIVGDGLCLSFSEHGLI
jgi:DNA repair protein RadC